MENHRNVKNRTSDETAKFLQRSYNLYVLCLQDKDNLLKSNLPWSLVDDIPTLVNLCSDMESSYQAFVSQRKKSSNHIATEFSAARKRTGTLLGKLRRVPELYSIKSQLPLLSACTKREQFIQFLSNLNLFGEQYHAILDHHMHDEFTWVRDQVCHLSELLTAHRLMFSVSINPFKRRKEALAQLTQT